MSKVRSRPESLVADCSMLAPQPPERRGRQGQPDESTAPAVSWCQQSEDSDERLSLMSAAGCQTGTPVLCRAHNGTPEDTTGTGFAPGRVTSERVRSISIVQDLAGKRWLYATAMSFCLSVCSFVCLLPKRVLVMAAGAYRVGAAAPTCLLFIPPQQQLARCCFQSCQFVCF